MLLERMWKIRLSNYNNSLNLLPNNSTFLPMWRGLQLNDVRRILARIIVIKVARQLRLESSFINSCFILFLSGEDP